MIVEVTCPAAELIERGGQARLWWDSTPVDVFLNTTEFHVQAAWRARIERLRALDAV